MKKKLTYALTALLGLGFAAQVLASPPLPGNRPPLTPEQIARIKASHQSKKRELTPAQQQMKQLTDQLRAEMRKKPVDREKVNSLVQQINAQRDTARIEQLQTRLNDPSLPPQQKQRYTNMIQRMKAHQAPQQK